MLTVHMLFTVARIYQKIIMFKIFRIRRLYLVSMERTIFRNYSSSSSSSFFSASVFDLPARPHNLNPSAHRSFPLHYFNYRSSSRNMIRTCNTDTTVGFGRRYAVRIIFAKIYVLDIGRSSKSPEMELV